MAISDDHNSLTNKQKTQLRDNLIRIEKNLREISGLMHAYFVDEIPAPTLSERTFVSRGKHPSI